MPRLRLAFLVGLDLGHSAVLQHRVGAVGNEGRHAADGERAAAVAGLDEEVGIGLEECVAHVDLGTIWQEVGRRAPERLQEREDVVPVAAVEAGHVIAELVHDLVHLERRRQRLDVDGGADGAARQSERILGEGEHLVPPPRSRWLSSFGR